MTTQGTVNGGRAFGFEVDPLSSNALAAGAAHVGLVLVVALAALMLTTRRAR